MGNTKNTPGTLYSVLILTWPNLISLARLISVPVIGWMLLEDHITAAFVVCVLAGLSDILDGFIARVLKTQSTVGAYLDPLADKVLLVGVFFLLSYKGWIEPWLFLLVIFRDFLIIGGTVLLFMFGKNFEVKPLMISKLNTLLQIITAAWILGAKAFDLDFLHFTNVLIYSVTITTILSGGAYMIVWLRYFAYNESEI